MLDVWFLVPKSVSLHESSRSGGICYWRVTVQHVYTDCEFGPEYSVIRRTTSCRGLQPVIALVETLKGRPDDPAVVLLYNPAGVNASIEDASMMC